MSQTRSYPCSAARLPALIGALKIRLEADGFSCQRLTTEDGGTLIQIERGGFGGWRKVVGMSSTLNVVFRHEGNAVQVEIGAGKWIDKAVVGTVSLFVLWPLTVTAGIGAWQQMKMPE